MKITMQASVLTACLLSISATVADAQLTMPGSTTRTPIGARGLAPMQTPPGSQAPLGVATQPSQPKKTIDCLASIDTAPTMVNTPMGWHANPGNMSYTRLNLSSVSIQDESPNIQRLNCRYLTGNDSVWLETRITAGECVVSQEGRGKGFVCNANSQITPSPTW